MQALGHGLPGGAHALARIPDKGEECLTLLGTKIVVEVDGTKVMRWRMALETVLTTGKMAPAEASKMAGRLVWATSWACDKVGRAWVKPFHAQALNPMINNVASPWLQAACQFWIAFLDKQPEMFITLDEHNGGRKKVHTWGDAAGESRWIAAVA